MLRNQFRTHDHVVQSNRVDAKKHFDERPLTDAELLEVTSRYPEISLKNRSAVYLRALVISMRALAP